MFSLWPGLGILIRIRYFLNGSSTLVCRPVPRLLQWAGRDSGLTVKAESASSFYISLPLSLFMYPFSFSLCVCLYLSFSLSFFFPSFPVFFLNYLSLSNSDFFSLFLSTIQFGLIFCNFFRLLLDQIMDLYQMVNQNLMRTH